MQFSTEQYPHDELGLVKPSHDDGGSTHVGSASVPNYDFSYAAPSAFTEGLSKSSVMRDDASSSVRPHTPELKPPYTESGASSSCGACDDPSHRPGRLFSPRGRRRVHSDNSPPREAPQGAANLPSAPQSQNYLRPPSPRLRLRPAWRHGRPPRTQSPVQCDQTSGASTPTPGSSRHAPLGVVKLDEIGTTPCPKCKSPSLFIAAPQIAGAIGALVYKSRTDGNQVYIGELLPHARADTPMTEGAAVEPSMADDYSAGGDQLERTHRERKRWQQLLKTMFDHLASRGNSESSQPHSLKMFRSAQLDREAFLQVFPQLPGVVGERLFAAFDVNKNGVIDFEEFSNGLAILSSANLNNKLRFIFNMYDLNGDGQLSRDEMSMMLYHIPSSFSFLSNGRSSKLDKDGLPYQRKSSSSSSSCRSSGFNPLQHVSRYSDDREAMDHTSQSGASSLEYAPSPTEDASGVHKKKQGRSIKLPLPPPDYIASAPPINSNYQATEKRLGFVDGHATVPPRGDDVPTEGLTIPHETSKVDLENMARLLRRDKATAETVKEFEVIVDKLVDRAFQIYDVGAEPKRVTLMTFNKFCEAVMKFQELKLALEVFCQETIQPHSFMPVPPDVLSTSRTTSKTNVLKSLGVVSVAAKKLRSSGPDYSHPATASPSPFHIVLQNTDRSCVSDIEETTQRVQTSTGCSGGPQSPRPPGWTGSIERRGDVHSSENVPDSSFVVDCSRCEASYICRVRQEDGTGLLWTHRENSLATRSPRPEGRIRPQPQQAMLPCLRAHGGRIDYCGWIEKDGRRTGFAVRRFYLLRDRFLYYYRSVQDLTPLHAILVSGCHCDKMINDPRVCVEEPLLDENGGGWARIEVDIPKKFQSRFGFEMRPHYRGGRKSFLYARTPHERDAWIKHINKASGVTGANFHDVYMLQEPLGKGKFATVYRAVNRSTMERVAVKILRKPDLPPRSEHMSGASSRSGRKQWFAMNHWRRPVSEDEEEENEVSIREFQRTEVAVLRLLYHPNLVRLLDVFNTNQYLYLVMEWGPSGDLRRTIDIIKQLNKNLERRRKNEADNGREAGLSEMWIPEWIVREIIIGVLQGLSYLHSPKRNVIHRDLKPDNVLLKILISQLKFTMKQCVSGLPAISPATFELSARVARNKGRSKTTPAAQFDRRLHWLDSSEQDKQAFPAFDSVEKRDEFGANDPSSPVRREDPKTPSDSSGTNDSLDTVDFYPNVDGALSDSNGAFTPAQGTPVSIQAVREQLRLAGLRQTSIRVSTPTGPAGQDLEGPRLTSPLSVPASLGAPLFPQSASSGAVQSVPLRKSVLDSNSPPKDSTLFVRLGTMNMRRDSEACERVAAETLNFWLFLHCLEWFDMPNVKARRKNRSLTLPATTAEVAGLIDYAGEGSPHTDNIPPFLSHEDSGAILQEALQKLRSSQTIQSMNALFSSSFVKDAIIPKITDFGLSKIVAPPSNQDIVSNNVGLATYAEEALGTAAYAAPEVLTGRRYTTSADLWSLGVVTYQLLSGGYFPVFREVSNSKSTIDPSTSETSGEVVSSLFEVSKKLKTSRRNQIKLVLLFLPDHAWCRVGNLSKEFVRKLLDIDPTTRLTARDALAEPWMSREFAFPN